MRKLSIVLGLLSMLTFTQCDILEDVAGEVINGGGEGGTTTPSLTKGEVIAGLQKAL